MPRLTLGDVQIVPTARCNLRCHYCRGDGTRSAPLPRRAVRVLLDDAGTAKARALHVGITGGEPLSEFLLVRWIVARAESAGRGSRRPHVRLLTNGLLLDDDKIRFLDRHRVEVQMSCDGGRRAQELRCKGTHRPVSALLAWLAASHPGFLARLSVAMTVTPATVDVIADSARWLLDHGVRLLHIAPVMGIDGSRRDGRKSQAAALDTAFERLFTLAVDYGDRHGYVPVAFFRKGLLDAAPRRSGAICRGPGNRSVALDADGTLAGCVVATRTYLPNPAPAMRPAVDALRMGAADAPLDGQFARMRQRAEAVGVFTDRERRHSSFGRCTDCEYSDRCRVCPLAPAFEREWDDPFRVPDFQCAFYQAMFKYRDRFPAQLPHEPAGPDPPPERRTR